MSEWFITDPDCLQCCRPVPVAKPDYYEFVEIIGLPGHVDGKPFWMVAHADINVKECAEEEIHSALNFFGYDDLKDFVLQNSPEDSCVFALTEGSQIPESIIDYQLIAEMIFETDALAHYCESEHPSWNSAVKCIAGITGLDLSEYLEKNKAKPKLTDRIQEAKTKESAGRGEPVRQPENTR